MAEWIYFIHPLRDNFAATMTDEEKAVWSVHFERFERMLLDGSIGFPRLLGDEPADAFAARLVEAEGVLLLPGSQFGHPDNHFRIGFGRENLPAAVERLEAFLDRA